jgi:valyl-tRNA synthetase
MSELAKAYEPQLVEQRLYQQWLDSGCFRADPTSDKPAFSIVIPPPNVTGILTLGHVLNNTIQDILCRRARMTGHEVLWLPGTDHAGLATQTAVEKALRKPEDLPARVRSVLESLEHVWDITQSKPKLPLTRQNIGRDAMLKLVWAWTEDRGGIIIDQLKKIGASCDWERERFTMDPGYAEAVLKAFVTLYEKGYIYRGNRMVNWCPASLTAISDEEVIPTAQSGKLYYVKYEVAERPGTFLEIATTRPETIMGDTAVAVSPRDPRFQDFIGLHCWRPFPRAQIPIIGDEAIDPEFGTGVLKVTPAHDRADFEIGLRHQLPAITILHPNGKIDCPDVPELDGMDRFEARKKSVELLAELGLFLREEPYQNNVGFSERGQVPIEPRLSEQWFLDYRKMLNGTMIEESLRVVREHLIRFFPDRWEKVYNHWLENIQDWCLSRQVFWGHRIPVWYRNGETKCQLESPGSDWEQDPDTLDTWASSWLWAYATMDEPLRKKFYPTNVLVTGPDIIFLWVARMIIAGLEFQPGTSSKIEDNIPFRDVYFTGLIRDNKGRKLSKSLGNSPDPLDLIRKFGADGLRFGLMRIAPQGQDIRFDEKQIEEGRNFCNKLWNACRFRQMQGAIDPQADPSQHHLSSFAQHILFRFDTALALINNGYKDYEFNTVLSLLYDFTWNQFCARFLEAAKLDFRNADSPTRHGTLATFDFILSRLLRLLHPAIPFITEEIWQTAAFGKTSIQQAPWPDHLGFEPDAIQALHADKVYGAVEAGRRLRSGFGIASNQPTTFLLQLTTSLSDQEMDVFELLLNAQEIVMVQERPDKTPLAITPLGDLFLPLAGLVDLEKEKPRLEKEIAKASSDLEREQKKLANEQMLAKAPAEKVTEWRRIEAEAQERLTKLQEQYRQLFPAT